jgi:hypothetical protein
MRLNFSRASSLAARSFNFISAMNRLGDADDDRDRVRDIEQAPRRLGDVPGLDGLLAAAAQHDSVDEVEPSRRFLAYTEGAAPVSRREEGG